jgi:hypothetical protein
MAMETMETKRLYLCIAGIFVMTVAASWLRRDDSKQYLNWMDVAEKVDCKMVERYPRDVNVGGPLVVADKTYFEHIIADEEMLKIIDERCDLKPKIGLR